LVTLGELVAAGVLAATGELAAPREGSAFGTLPPLEELVGGVTSPALGGSGASMGFSTIGPAPASASVIGYAALDGSDSARQIGIRTRNRNANGRMLR
jgi:hypothetical protein